MNYDTPGTPRQRGPRGGPAGRFCPVRSIVYCGRGALTGPY